MPREPAFVSIDGNEWCTNYTELRLENVQWKVVQRQYVPEFSGQIAEAKIL